MPSDLSPGDYEELAELRYQIRRFLHFSESVAQEQGLEPRQHQALLAVKAMPGPCTIGALASRLFLQHQSTVGLVDRLVLRKLVTREHGREDARQVIVKLTSHGDAILKHLSLTHQKELQETAPALARALAAIIEKNEN